MYADPYPQPFIGHVSYAKGANGVAKFKRHVGNLAAMTTPVANGDATNTHVRVANGFNLNSFMNSKSDEQIPTRNEQL